MMRRTMLVFGLILLIVPLAAGEQGKGKEKAQRGQERTSAAVAVHVFAGPDITVLREYAASFRGNLPPGLAKRKGNLPPGLEKQLVRKGHLPPGLVKKIVPFPPELERRLTPLEPGYQRGFIEGRAVIFNSATRLILDVFVPLD
ncbi:MAG: hypothetical protein ACE141_12945 [Bryobacteraceae bacterium]